MRDGWSITPAHSRDGLLAQCRRALGDGTLQPGQRLPNERQLAQMSGLSRSTVRAAFDLLEREGLIVRHVGRGTFVAEPQEGAGEAVAAQTDFRPAELMEFRLVVEPALVELIVVTATDSRLEALLQTARRGRDVVRWQEAEEADRAFHRALFDATDNRIFADLGHRLSAMRDSRSWMRLKEGSFSLEKWRVYQQEHEAIVAALLDRNAESARNALRRHLGGVRANAQMATSDL
ncbi:FCD domain-containing protein [Aquibium sp. A9E412]|uniref:FadR/GntR family transcriptional regulator n=1 Tax=Aquibium sp. A9E412 TaxID=2976767 RepID=UPI0025AFA015|nr:FCD domain-containing protein [Aquibium sp. A9E412]MDN2567467.1 FCD domain-containing protein [Aquibium sp. A9E412]